MALPLRITDRRRELSAAQIEADIYLSTLKEDQLLKLAETFKIPDDIKYHLPTPSCHPSRPPKGWVAVCLDRFDAGLRLPLCSFYGRILNTLNIALLQLNPNVD